MGSLSRGSKDHLRQRALVGPRLEVHVPDGQAVVDGLDIVGEDVAVGHLVQVSRNGVCGTVAR